MGIKDIAVMADINAENDRIAEGVRQTLAERRIYCINIIGSPGTGKTSCLINIIQGIKDIGCYVIEGDIQSDIDTQKLAGLGIGALQINTGGACRLDATLISNTLERLPPIKSGVLFIENIGNLICPAGSDIGENLKLLIINVTEGADKPYKYPAAFVNAGAILLNKIDLLPYVDFDMEYFMHGVRILNAEAPVFQVSAMNGTGFSGVCEWLKTKISTTEA